MDSAAAWRRFYHDERTRLGPDVLSEAVEQARPLTVRSGGAIVIPHTRLEVTAPQIGAAVATVLASGTERVLAVGVLHGGRREDRELVAAARRGDTDARDRLRGVHDEDGVASEEFSLDGFAEMFRLATARLGRPVEMIRRYPFLVGDDPSSLPGFDELRQLVDDGAMLVVTTDPVHHGRAYDTPPAECRDPDAPATLDHARSLIDAQFAALAAYDFARFGALAEECRSDFRDTGPVMAALVGPGFDATVHRLDLVDYAAALDAPDPSWVAAALATV